MLTSKKIFEAVLALVMTLTFKELLTYLTLSQDTVIYLASLSSALVFMVNEVSIYVKDRLFDEEHVKPVVIKVDNTLIYQTVKFRVRRVCSILINLVGAALPLLISVAAVLTIILASPNLLLQLLLNTLFLTFLYNKLSILIKDKGIGIPIALSTVLTIILSVATAVCFSLDAPTAFLITFASSAIALLVGVDLMNLSRVALFNVRKIIIGGMGVADALLLIPAMSALMTVNIVKVLAGF
ncbi:MAG: DUF1614 domain-containing protein [Desulfurococcales archaeon]|nr:DUF1614 domain-containing protein [Desulfurococcales archaeon]